MTVTSVWVVSGAALLALSALVGRRLNAAAQPLRLELAQNGEELLQLPGLSRSAAVYICFMLDTAFGMRLVILAAFIAVPLLSLAYVFVPARAMRLGQIALPESAVDAARFRDLCRLHDRITVANHPVLMMMLAIWIWLLMVPVMILRSAVTGKMLPEPRVEATIVVIINKLHGRFRGRSAAASPC